MSDQDRETRRVVGNAIAANAVRWSCNVLVEVLGNHGEHLPDEVRDAIKLAVATLQMVRWK
jgi:hypothetical protein